MLPEKPIHFVNGKQLCDQQYAAYLESSACARGRQAGIKEVVEWIKTHQLIKPDDDSLTRFEPFYHIELGELKEWGIWK